MANKIVDRVWQTSTTTGTGTLSLTSGAAATGFQTFVSGVGNGNTCYYAISQRSSANWEVGIGTVTSGTPDTLSRTTVLASSNSGSLVNFSAGTKDVWVTIPAKMLSGLVATQVPYVDANGLLTGSAHLTFSTGGSPGLTCTDGTNTVTLCNNSAAVQTADGIIAGSLRLTNSPTTGYCLTCTDGLGDASWAVPPYTPATPSDWAGTAPTDVWAALDRCATLLKTLNGGTGP